MEAKQFEIGQEVYFMDFSTPRKAEVLGIIAPKGKFDKYEEGYTYYWLSGQYMAYKTEELFPTKDALVKDILTKLS